MREWGRLRSLMFQRAVSGGSDPPVYPTKTVTGTVVTITDAVKAAAESLEVAIEPQQDLHGYGMPWAYGAGKNILNYNAWKDTAAVRGDAVWENNGVTLTATTDDCFTTWGSFPTAARVPVTSGSSYILTWESDSDLSGRVYVGYGGNKNTASANNEDTKELAFTAPAGVTWVQFRFGVDTAGDTIAYKNIMIRRHGTSGTYEPPENICPITGYDEVDAYVSPTLDAQDGQTYPVSIPATPGIIYGGTLDVVTGELSVDMACIASYAGETLPGAWISDRDEYAVGTTPSTGAQVVYELAQPSTYQLTPVEVAILRGTNNVWSNAGDISLTYQYKE